MLITIYKKNHCVQCEATKQALDRRGIHYQLIDVEEQPDVLVELKSWGFRQLPVITTEVDAWSGFRLDKIIRLALPKAG